MSCAPCSQRCQSSLGRVSWCGPTGWTACGQRCCCSRRSHVEDAQRSRFYRQQVLPRNKAPDRSSQMSKRLFVGNLSFQTTEAGLTAIFAQDGRQVTTVTLVLDRDTGRSRGFAFVEMSTEADAQKAIKALNSTQFEGRTLKVDIAAERKPRTDRDDRRQSH